MSTYATRLHHCAQTDQNTLDFYIAEAHRMRNAAISAMVRDALDRLRRVFAGNTHGANPHAHGAA